MHATLATSDSASPKLKVKLNSWKRLVPTTTFKMVETLSLKNAFPFRIAQKIKKVRNSAFDPPPPFQSCCLTKSMLCAQVSNIEMGEGGERLVNIWKSQNLPKKGVVSQVLVVVALLWYKGFWISCFIMLPMEKKSLKVKLPHHVLRV